MQPTYTLKRKLSVDYDMCIICQEGRHESLRHTDQGVATLTNSAQLRNTFNDPNYRVAIENIISGLNLNIENCFKWHKTCYSSFTSKWHIERLKKSLSEQSSASSSSQHQDDVPKTRSSIGQVMNWKLCMFCQDAGTKEHLSSVSTFKKSTEI